jgi:hypothetical protein
MKTFVTVISASTGRNDFIFDIWLLHGDLYRVSPFQVYSTSTSCLQCDLEFFMFAVMKTFVTVISASTGRNDFIFDISLGVLLNQVSQLTYLFVLPMTDTNGSSVKNGQIIYHLVKQDVACYVVLRIPPLVHVFSRYSGFLRH